MALVAVTLFVGFAMLLARLLALVLGLAFE
jgi:hypothetical protein